MNKLLAGAVIVIVVAGGAYFALNKKSDDATGQQDSQNQQSNTEQQSLQDSTGTQNSSLREILAQGTRKCTYSYEGNAALGEPNGNGTIYTANGNAGMDITAVVNGVSMNSKVVIKDGIYYGWTDGQPTGLKMTLSDADKYNNNASVRQGVDMDQRYGYTCTSWNIDDSKFSVPANVQFTDVGALSAQGHL